MARVNIQVDLKESDLIEKEIIREAKGLSKGIAREAMRDELSKEIERLVDAKLQEAKKSDYYNNIAKTVTNIVANRISGSVTISNKEIDDLITEKVESYLNNRVREYGGIENFIQNYINKSIKSLLK